MFLVTACGIGFLVIWIHQMMSPPIPSGEELAAKKARLAPKWVRKGFTLIELLVALTIMLVLITLSVGLVNTLSDDQRAASGPIFMQKWLGEAKNRSSRDRVPAGLRLIPDGQKRVGTLIPVQEPPDFGGSGTLSADASTDPGETPIRYDIITLSGCSAGRDFFGPHGPGPFQSVQVGDFVKFYRSSPADPYHRIVSVTDATHLVIFHDDAPTVQIINTDEWAIRRSPRPLQGEQELKLPQDVVVDLSMNDTYGAGIMPNPVTGNLDLLFAPSGQVTGLAATNGKLVFWFRDLRDQSVKSRLVCVHSRSGLVRPCDLDPTVDSIGDYVDPYKFTRD